MRRGTSRRGRGRGNIRVTANIDERESALQRLGKVVYPKAINDKYSKKYGKNGRSQTVSSCIVALPGETRIKVLTKKFLKSYYEIFDQPGRVNLQSQYSPDAFFSISSTHPMPLIHFGRNLLVVRDHDPRISMLFDGRPKIADVLTKLTPTEHLVNYLTVDVPYYMASPMAVTCLQLVVTGVFKDTSQTTDPLRAFTRIFVLKHTTTDTQGEPTYQIFNDMFMIQAPSTDQIKRYHQDAQDAKRQSSFHQQQQQANSSNTSGAGRFTKSTKEHQIESIMSKTNMNKVGSTKLLEDCGWDEDKSMATFNKLYPENKIPQEFFTK